MSQLPEGFEDLAPGLPWALLTERQRFTKRLHARQEELQAYYDLMIGRMPAITALLGGYDLGDALPEDVRRLYWMALALMEVSMSVERFHEPDESGVFAAERYIVKDAADLIVSQMARR